jgi:general secretion pathway protein A
MRVLEEIRLLSGVETTKEKVLRIILAGQPELNEKLDAPELIQLTQRIRLRFHLSTLSAQEMHAYIQHRLEVAGASDRQIFAEDCFPEIFRYSGGVPRLVNTLCDTAMMAAFTANHDTVAREDIAQALEELQWVEYSARNALQTKAPTESRSSPSVAPGTAGSVTNEDGQFIHGRLLVATDGRTIEERMLRVGRIIVGRTPDNDLQIDSRFVSRHHCQIITTQHSCVIEDLNSTNGIYVKSKRVRRHYLNDGDVYVDERMARTRAAMTDTVPGVNPHGGFIDTGVVDEEQLE